VILPCLSSHVTNTLTIAWKNADPTMQELQEIDQQDMTNEIVQDLILRNVSRSYGDLWFHIFAMSGEKDKQDEFRYPALVTYCFQDMSLVNEWTRGIAFMTSVLDTVTCRIALDVSSRMISLLVSIPASWSFLQILMKSSIKVLMSGYHTTNHYRAASVVTDIYIKLKALSPIPLESFQAIRISPSDIQVLLD
jgi:hypothetical protein